MFTRILTLSDCSLIDSETHQTQRLLYGQTSLAPAFWCLTLF
jgi:hypothetical protein